MKKLDYNKVVCYWSIEDSAYLAKYPTKRGTVRAHGDTKEEALKELEAAYILWQQEGRCNLFKGFIDFLKEVFEVCL